ncbi:copper homeostasis periplasmic binding protein CopC [Rugamonas sp. FT107W]|uniref:Copper homeostasis periplasmic binding protein CopC n=1 Tax=Duganella vulcania TaxID=2692166 RepID=A0A845HFC3_9BURK|nr:copper homeostasis periplasmic binding protein CopC [Duganella vulcania]MYN17441.1 copper homeostasis periplasmic binding protein CopC [Duganella vulcania]
MKALYNTIAAATVAAAVLASPMAMAHATLKSSDPAAGSIVDAAPKAIALTFNEKIEPAFSNITVADGAGKELATGKATVDEADPAILRLAVAGLSAGTYTVSWAVAGHDGHRRKGDFKFTVK